jgi:hypothetical protein
MSNHDARGIAGQADLITRHRRLSLEMFIPAHGAGMLRLSNSD